jgi:two-component system, NtrC family, response regulator AtoC
VTDSAGISGRIVAQQAQPDQGSSWFRKGCLSDQFYLSWSSREMQSVQRMIRELSRTDLPILVVGESGTGKEIVALQIHDLSGHSELPFVKLSCTAFSTESFQTQLREIENGWFSKDGATLGTIFFDEISELDSSCQRRVLHLFPEGHGLKSPQGMAGRIVACTAADLESEVHSGRFRSELFYRLNGISLKLPPLRHRREDIPNLVQFFLRKHARMFHRAEMTLSEATLRKLFEYSWPGNIRELENLIKKIVALDNEELAVADLSTQPSPLPSPSSVVVKRSLKAAAKAASQEAERELILQTLAWTHWNRKKAAAALQISYKSLLYKLKQIRMPESAEF